MNKYLKIVSATIVALLVATGPVFSMDDARELSKQALHECHLGRTAKDREVRLAHFEQSEILAKKAVELDDQVPDAHFALFCSMGEKLRIDGELFASIWGFGRMLDALDQTLELDPNHLDALSSKGTILVRVPTLLGGDPEKGEKMLLHVIKKDPTAVNARLTLARIYADRGDHKTALVLASQAVKNAKEHHREDLLPEAKATLSELQSHPH